MHSTLAYARDMRPAEVRVSTSMQGTCALEQLSHAGTFPSHCEVCLVPYLAPAALKHTLIRRSRQRSQARRTFLGCLELAVVPISMAARDWRRKEDRSRGGACDANAFSEPTNREPRKTWHALIPTPPRTSVRHGPMLVIFSGLWGFFMPISFADLERSAARPGMLPTPATSAQSRS